MQKNRNVIFKLFRDTNLKLYNSRIKTSAYLDLEEYFPEYKILEENWLDIKKEIERVIELITKGEAKGLEKTEEYRIAKTQILNKQARENEKKELEWQIKQVDKQVGVANSANAGSEYIFFVFESAVFISGDPIHAK